MQSRGVKLHELEVFDCCAGLPGQRNPFTGGLSRIGGVGVEVTAAPGGKNDGPGSDPVEERAINHLHAAAPTVFDPEFANACAPSVQQSLSLFDPLSKNIHQRATRLVLHMQHPVMAVGRL